MTTEETIIEIQRQFHYAEYAVLRPQSEYNGVDWTFIAKHFCTEKINAYTQGDKIVIDK